MYTVAVRCDFIAHHFLIGGDWGAENHPNSHHYVLELRLSGQALDKHGYLVDIVEIQNHLDEVVASYKEKLLNDQPAFSGLNPSIEHFSRILAEALSERITAPNVQALSVVLWENDHAWASYTIEKITA